MIQKYTPRLPQSSKLPNVNYSAVRGFGKKKKKAEETSDPLSYYKTAREATEKEYRNAGERLERETEEKIRRASVNYELLKKYLPIEAERAGLSGLGVSESAGIEARNAHQRRVGEIEDAHGERQALLDAAHQKEQAALAERYLERQADTEQTALQREGYERSAQNSVYKNALSVIENEQFSSLEELERFISSLEPHVRDEQYAVLTHYLNYYKSNPDYFKRK